jgi:hypothetical protein
MGQRHHIFLIPGFFGFANLGDFAYFAHVRDFFVSYLRRHGVSGEIHVVRTYPTASLLRRATRVLETVAEALHDNDDVAHLIGHSSGGLDARLMVSPEANLATTLDVEQYVRRVRSVVSLSSPHRGSPVAAMLTGLRGPQLLRLFSLGTVYMLRTGRMPIAAVFELIRLLSLKRLPVAEGALINNIYRGLLADFDGDRREALEAFLVEVEADQELLGQLGPSGMEQFNIGTLDRPGIRYGSVVTCARPPGIRTAWATGLSPYRQSTHALFLALYRIAARVPRDRVVALTKAQAVALMDAYDGFPELGANDGMVPTLSQVWGDVVHATWGDHLDTIGHFYLPTHVPPHFDWLNSGQHFGLTQFDRLWHDVARFLFPAAP